MNGTIFDKMKREENTKKREKFKFFATVLMTNLLVISLCLSLRNKSESVDPPTPKSFTIHPHYKMVVIPLKLLADVNPLAKETPVTLLTKSKKIFIAKAYLHEEVLASNKELSPSLRYKIEVPEENLVQMSASENEGDVLMAIPEIKIMPPSKINPIKRVSHYEINL
jgi:hypothetical protein